MNHPAGTIALIRIGMTAEEVRCARVVSSLQTGWADLANLDRFWNDGGVSFEVVRILPVVDLGDDPKRLLSAFLLAADAVDNHRDGLELEAAALRGWAGGLAEQLRGPGPAEPTKFGAKVDARTDDDIDGRLWIRMCDDDLSASPWTDGRRFRVWARLKDIEVLG